MASKDTQIIRLVSEGGRVSFRWCRLDEDGDVDAISTEPITLQSGTYSNLLRVMELCMQCSSLPRLVVNAGNKSLYNWD